MLLWMTRLSGFLIGACLGTLMLAAPEAVAQWPFGGPQPLDAIEEDIASDHADIAHLEPEALAAMQAAGKDIILLDVRARDEYDVSHIPGALQVDPGASKTDIAALLADTDPAAEIVVYCSVGRRSSRLGSRVLNALDGRDVSNLRGGIFAWHNQARPLEDAQGATDAVHPYNDRWGKLVDRKDAIAYRPATD